MSRSDPDAKLRYKPGHRPHLVHRAQVASDPKHRVIVAVHAERATGHKADSLPVIIDRARWLKHKVDELVADAGYASALTYQELDQAKITAFIPPQPNMRHSPHGQAARSRCKSSTGVGAAVDRITHGEGAIAEIKRHGAGRARSRGTRKLQAQLLLAATAINLKRLINQQDAGKNGACGDDHAHQAAIRAQLAIHSACLRALAPTPSPTSTTGS